MAAHFAALENRLNTAVFAHLANTQATVDGIAVDAIYDSPYSLGTVGVYGMATSASMLTLPTAQVPEAYVGKSVVLKGVPYTIAEHQPDGSGISRLFLEKA